MAYTSGNGKRTFVNFGELNVVVNALTVGEELLRDLGSMLLATRP